MFLVFVLFLVLLSFIETKGEGFSEKDSSQIMNDYNLVDDVIKNYTKIVVDL